MSILYQANTIMRVFGFLSRTLLGIIIGFFLGVTWAHGSPIMQSLVNLIS